MMGVVFFFWGQRISGRPVGRTLRPFNPTTTVGASTAVSWPTDSDPQIDFFHFFFTLIIIWKGVLDRRSENIEWTTCFNLKKKRKRKTKKKKKFIHARAMSFIEMLDRSSAFSRARDNVPWLRRRITAAFRVSPICWSSPSFANQLEPAVGPANLQAFSCRVDFIRCFSSFYFRSTKFRNLPVAKRRILNENRLEKFSQLIV